jgi:hypothetical protein
MTKFYAVSGLVNAETLHVFGSKQERDAWVAEVSNRTNNHYTLENAKAATLKEAIRFMGGQRRFNDAVEAIQYR